MNHAKDESTSPNPHAYRDSKVWTSLIPGELLPKDFMMARSEFLDYLPDKERRSEIKIKSKSNDKFMVKASKMPKGEYLVKQ